MFVATWAAIILIEVVFLRSADSQGIKAIVEGAFIYAFAMVMNYGVIDEYFIKNRPANMSAGLKRCTIQPKGHSYDDTQWRHCAAD